MDYYQTSQCNHWIWSEKPTCYFCNKNLKWKFIQLKDGCLVPGCGACLRIQLDVHPELEEKIYDTNQIRKGRGGERSIADIQKAKESEGIPYIGKKLYQEKQVTEVKIKTEFAMQDCDYQGKITQKPVGKVETKNPDIPEAIWEMNKATQNYFVDKFGTDSSKWITDEWIPIKLAAAGNANPSIYPKDVSLEKTF